MIHPTESAVSPVYLPPRATSSARLVTPYTSGQEGHQSVHETATRAEAVRRIATLQGGTPGE